jgi:hypothetical protein
MASVYSNGYLTTAGTKSANGRGGLFIKRPDFRVLGTTPDGEEYCLCFRERIDHQIDSILGSAGMTCSVTYYPLISRAWVYQGRMLSTRVSHFGRYELFFGCKSSILCECGAIRFHGAGIETPIPLIKIEYADALSAYEQGYKDETLESVKYQGAQLWRTMVSCYTALRLTKSKDRLQQGSKDYLMSLVLRRHPLQESRFESIGMLKLAGPTNPLGMMKIAAGPTNSVIPDSTIFHGAESRTVVIV